MKKYRVSPLNILAGLCILIIVWYLFNAITKSNYDNHGWAAVFTLIPSIFFGVVFLVLDFIIQSIFNTKKYYWLIITEVAVLIVLLVWQWGLVSTFLNF